MKPDRRIFILSELYFPEQTSTGYLITKIAEALAEDYDIKVITGPETNFLPNNSNPLTLEVKNKVEIFRCYGTKFNKYFILGRFFNLFTRSIAIFCKSLFLLSKKDIILVVTNPPLLPFVALVLKWLKQSELVLLVHDVYPEVLIAINWFKKTSLIVKIIETMNRVLYAHTSKIITLGRDMTRLAKKKLGDDQQKIYCIPNWADNDLVMPTERTSNQLLQELGWTNNFVVLYAGNMGKTHGIENIAEAANIIKNDTNIRFLFLGFGAKKDWLKKYVNDNNMSLVKIISPRPRSEQINFLNACDIAIISFLPGMAGISVPSRMYNQMAAGKPIIAVTDDWSELAEVIREEGIGWVVKPNDVNGLVETINFAYSNPQLCIEMGKKASLVAQTKYSFRKTYTAYKNLFRELLDNSNTEIKH